LYRESKLKKVICVVALSLVVTLPVCAAPTLELPDMALSPIPTPELPAKSWLLLDFHSGFVLAARNPDQRVEPASLNKLMVAYLVFEALKKGSFKLDSMVTVSERAWRAEGSRMFINVHSQVKVEDLLRGMIIQSGNDATIALAEQVAGTEEAFAQLMTQTAKRLGMENTNFTNAPGLPHPENYSTARDLAILSAAIIREYPDYYKYYSEKEFFWNKIKQENRNLLLYRDPTVDGIKTGHTQSAGYSLIGSANRDGRRLIAAVIGSTSMKQRAQDVTALLQYGYSAYQSVKAIEAGVPLGEAAVKRGAEDKVPVGVAQAVSVIVPRGLERELNRSLSPSPEIVAPLEKGRRVGSVTVKLRQQALAEAPLIALQPVAEAGWMKRVMGWVTSFWK
jgi:D-alanyl-D-alanine carboxypeptidase (penicillin-binding protein 5/6)